jgi:uncharacterized membrane protein
VKRLSRLTVAVLLTAFVIGVAEGAVNYSHRSSAIKRHVADMNAVTVHTVLAIVAMLVVVAIQIRRSRQPTTQRGHSPWFAPFSTNAMSRLSRTIRLSRGMSVVRLLPTMLLVLVLLYAPFRMGAQIVGGIDPNSTVNAWGGPTYLGAFLAHWLDCIVGFYAAAFLLSRVLVATDS